MSVFKKFKAFPLESVLTLLILSVYLFAVLIFLLKKLNFFTPDIFDHLVFLLNEFHPINEIELRLIGVLILFISQLSVALMMGVASTATPIQVLAQKTLLVFLDLIVPLNHIGQV